MLKIGEFSKLSRISIRMLRHYDELGLLEPLTIDKFSGYRYYSESQLITAGKIAAFKDMGFSLSEIAEMLAETDAELIGEKLDKKKSELSNQLLQTKWRIKLVETARERLRKDYNAMKYDVTLKTLPERYVASIRKIIPSYKHEGMLWGIMMQETAPLNMTDGDPCLCSVIFHDGEYKEENVDIEAMKTVIGSYPDTENVKFKKVAPITFASATYKGPYEMINEVNIAVAQWVSDNGYEFADKTFNIYHVSPNETNDPNEFVTEVCYPVKKK